MTHPTSDACACPFCGSPMSAPPAAAAALAGRVVDLAAGVFGVSRHEVIGGTRHQPACFVRQVCMTLLHERGGFSLFSAAQAFGYSDHATCSNAIRRVHMLCEVEPETRARVTRLRTSLEDLLP